MKDNYKVIIVIPAYNEERKIFNVVSELKAKHHYVVVVDDGSSDETAAKASLAGATVIKHIINRGQGAALQTGDQWARKHSADIVVHFDADGQFLASEIEDMILPILEEKADIVFGSRFLSKRSKLPFVKRYLLLPLGQIINYLLLGVNYSDPQIGFRAFNSSANDKIQILNDGAAHCSEIQHQAKANSLRVAEVPVTVNYDNFGQSVLSGKGRRTGGIRIILDLIISKLIN